MTYKNPQIEEMKTLADNFFKEADKFIEKYKSVEEKIKKLNQIK